MSLAALMAAQKAKKESPDATAAPTNPPAETPAPAESTGQEAAAEVVAPAKTGLAFLKGAGKPAVVESKPTDGTVASPTPAGGLGFLKNRIGSAPVQAAASSPSQSSTALVPHSAVPKVAIKESTGPVTPMSDLDSLLNNEQPQHRSRFADEIPATGPTRELPEGLDAAGKAFVDSLDSIYRVLHEPDLLGGAVKSIMIELQNHPEYRKLISPMDVHSMVRGMRESMGLARIRKEEAKTKRSPKAKKTEINDLAVLEALEGMDFS